MQKSRIVAPVALAITSLFAAESANAFDFTSGDWKFAFNGNINVDYAFTHCESSPTAITTVGGACTGNSSGSNVSDIGNGLLPAAMDFAVSTTQDGYDIKAQFGLYPGIASNDGGSPNIQSTPGPTNVALATTGLDVRQVFMTFGNANMGTVELGRDFGLFGFDAIINDMTIRGVGVPGGLASHAPANTTLGSIGFGYIYTDTLAQMDYTTRSFNGLTGEVGIFNPIDSLTQPAGTSSEGKSEPGVHGKIAYKHPFNDTMKLYLSSTFIEQQQKYNDTATDTPYSYRGYGFDGFGKFDIGGLSLAGSYYYGKGLGTTGLFVLSDDGLGHRRGSEGYLLQATYTMQKWTLGVNYGVSRLGYANAADQAAVPDLLASNSKITGGVYYQLTKALTLLAEVTDVDTKAHNEDSNRAIGGNVGAFLSF